MLIQISNKNRLKSRVFLQILYNRAVCNMQIINVLKNKNIIGG